MTKVIFEYVDKPAITVEMPCPASQVDTQVQQYLNSVGNEFTAGGKVVPKDFQRYSFD